MAKIAEAGARLKLQKVAMTDGVRGGDPCRTLSALPAGAWLIFRHYDLPERARLARRLAILCRQRRVRLLVAGDFGLAVALGAGLHLPDHLGRNPSVAIRLWRRRGGALTVAAHDRQGLRRAQRLGADAALLSPIFATESHPGGAALGLLALRRLARAARVTVIALGGIDLTRLRALRSAPIAGIAAVGLYRRDERSPRRC